MAGNPVVLAPPVEGVDAAGMTGFKGKPVVREPRPPRGYVPPAPERKVRSWDFRLGSKRGADSFVGRRG